MPDSGDAGGVEGLSPTSAAVALANADRSAAAVRHRGSWAAWYFLTYAVATMVFLPAMGLSTGHWSLFVTAAWTGFVLAAAAYAYRQRVLRRGSRRLYLATTGAWAFLWLSAMVVGESVAAGQPWYWVPAGLAVSLPLFVATRLVSRR
jgi:hypothetical protein